MNLMHDLRLIHDRQKRRLRSLYDSIVKDCTSKIKNAANLKKMRILYELPLVQEGLPLYDVDSCRRYLVKYLGAQGFECNPTGSRFLVISWKSAVAKPLPKDEKAPKQVGRRAEKETVPPLPPILGKDDLFALPSIKNLHATAKQLRG